MIWNILIFPKRVIVRKKTTLFCPKWLDISLIFSIWISVHLYTLFQKDRYGQTQTLDSFRGTLGAWIFHQMFDILCGEHVENCKMLFTNLSLPCRRLSEDELCAICRSEVETKMHSLWSCSMANDVGCDVGWSYKSLVEMSKVLSSKAQGQALWLRRSSLWFRNTW